MTQGHLIKALLIFNRKTGTPFVYYVTDKDFNTEPGLIIGLLNSVLDFSKIIEQNLQMFDLESFRMVFTEKQNIVFNAISNRLVNPMDLLFKLNTIETIFLNEYTEAELANPNIRLNYFDNFLEKIKEIIDGDLRVLENRPQVKKILDAFNKKKFIIGSAVLSFAGNFLVNTFSKSETNLIQALFNTNFEMIVSGINKAIIEFLDRTFYVKKIDDQTVFIVMVKNIEEFEKVEKEIEKVRKNIKEAVSKKA
ncbi:MAG: hypothetical protein ACFFCM_09150 [Promethearchaeota archaeon]